MNDGDEGDVTTPGPDHVSRAHSMSEAMELLDAAYEALEKAEANWRPAFSGVSLATELPVPSETIEEITNAIAQISTGGPESPSVVASLFPACLVLSLTGIAIDVYEGGAYWPGFFERIGKTPGQLESSHWGDGFLRALAILNLPTFADRPKKYLGPLLGHAGVPNYCLPDYFRAIDMGMRRVGSSADAIVAWAIPRVDTSLANIDVPVRQFITAGGEYSLDFVDRTLDLFIRLSTDQDPAPARLPARFVDGARRHLKAVGLPAVRPRNSGSRGGSRRAEIQMDPFEGRVSVALPGVEDVSDDFVWEIEADSETYFVRPQRSMGGARIGARDASWTVGAPYRQITVGAAGLDRSQDIDLVDSADPVLFFSDEGVLLPGHLPLPADQVWALYAPPAEIGSFLLQKHIVHEEQPPLGWTGWRLSLLDLSGAVEVQRCTDSPRHWIQSAARVAFRSIGVLPSVRSGGIPVHAACPEIHIPDNLDEEWYLTVVDADTQETVVERTIHSSVDTHDVVNPFEGLPSPINGRFSVAVRGPLGKGARRVFAIAEGLQMSPADPFREFAEQGLASLTLTFSGEGLTAEPSELEFPAEELELPMLISAPSGTLEVLVTPPSMAVATVREHVPSRWSYGMTRIDLEEIADTSLVVRIPRTSLLPLAQVTDDTGTVLQELRPDAAAGPDSGEAGAGQVVFNLATMADTAQRLGSSNIVIWLSAKPFRIARIDPRRVAAAAVIEDGRLRLTEFGGGSVAVRVWSVWEPWHEPHDAHVDADGTAPLPPELQAAGTLAVSWQRYDPWQPPRWERFPDRRSSHFATAPLAPNAQPSSVALSSGATAVEAIAVPRAWMLLAMRPHAPATLLPLPVVEALTASIAQRPFESLAELERLGLAPAEQLRLLVASGILWASAPGPRDEAGLTDIELERAVRTGSVTGALRVFPALSGEASVTELPATWARATTTYGVPLASILAGQGDPESNVGRLDNANKLDALPPESFAEIIRILHVIPRAILDADSRQAAALIFFDKRRSVPLAGTVRAAHTFSVSIMRHFARTGHPVLAAAIESRCPEQGSPEWAYVSPLSIACALLARLASRGDTECRALLAPVVPYIEALATHCPDLFAIDVVLAEALVAAEHAEAHPVLPTAHEDGEDEQ